MLAKYGFTADVILIPGTPRTIQALIAGDLDYVAAGAPASLRARAQGADVTILSTLANVSAQRVFLRPDSKLNSFTELRGKIIGVTQYGSGGDTFLRAALRKTGIKESEVTILQMGGTPASHKVWNRAGSKSACSAIPVCCWFFAGGPNP